MSPLLLWLALVSGPTWADDPASSPAVEDGGAPTSEGGSVLPPSSPAAGTAPSARPWMPPARTPLYERPVEILWWMLWWMPDHWRGEAIGYLLALLSTLVGFVATRIGLRHADPSRFSWRDPRRWVVAAFADAPPEHEEEVDASRLEALEQTVTVLRGEIRRLERAQRTMEARVAESRADLLERIRGADTAALETLIGALEDALGVDDAPSS